MCRARFAAPRQKIAPAVVLQRTRRGNEHDGARTNAGTADDVDVLLEAHVGAEPPGDDELASRCSASTSATSELFPCAMFANGSVDDRGRPSSVWIRFGFSASFQEDGHRAGRFERLRSHGLAGSGTRNRDRPRRAQRS